MRWQHLSRFESHRSVFSKTGFAFAGNEPLDSAHPRASAALWIMDAEQQEYERQPQCVLQGELRMVNERARTLDYKLAEIVSKVDGA